jgi:hypothetical protein
MEQILTQKKNVFQHPYAHRHGQILEAGSTANARQPSATSRTLTKLRAGRSQPPTNIAINGTSGKTLQITLAFV